jgi:hypothetical protein
MINPIFDIVSPILDKVLAFIPNPVEREKVKAEQTAALLAAIEANASQQVDVDKVEAANESLFVSGWRPCVGWICAVGIGWTFVLQPVANWFLAIYKPGTLVPVLDSGQLMTLLLGMLGMGALRSVDKYNEVETK